MTNQISPTLQQLYAQIQNLPEQNLPALAEYIEFLAFKARERTAETPSVSTLRLVQLRGILKGCDVPPALLAEARREMWKSLIPFSPDAPRP